MRTRVLVMAAMAVAVLSGIAVAQTTVRPAETRAAPATVQRDSAQLTVDPVTQANNTANLALKRTQALESRVTSLEHQVTALEATVRKTQPALTFRCSADGQSSINSMGVVEQCNPYLCAPIDGRCLKQAISSGDCRSGYHWDGDRSCVAG